ncbi:MAG: SGNH/GDSL hydrolase family protein [Planctomycetes bacterium]|nr:SGNH/GDSL hydrolase family protein [Planctomycetota bacterium]
MTRRLAAACVLAAAAAAVLLAVAPDSRARPLLLAPLCAAAGLLLALWRGADRTASARPLLRWLALAVFLAVAAGTGALMVQRDARRAPAPASGAAPEAAAAFREAGPLLLDQGNALPIPLDLTDFDLCLRIKPGFASVLEARLHAPPASEERAEGIAFFTGCDPRFRTSFYEESAAAFARIGSGVDSLNFTPDRSDVRFARDEHALRLRAQGGSYSAWLDGRLVAEARNRAFSRGEAVLLAARGRLLVSEVEVARLDPVPSPGGLRLVLALAPLFFLLLFGLLQAGLTPLRFRESLGLAALTSMPMGAALALSAPASAHAAVARAELLSLGVLLLLAPALALRRCSSPWAFLILPALAFAGAGGVIWAWPAPAAGARGDLRAWSGSRMERDLAYIQHPAFRDGNPYLARHGFQSGSAPVEKPPQELRVVFLGAGETAGPGEDGRDFPAEVAARLEEGADLGSVRVINAAWPGAPLAALSGFLAEVLLGYDPDVVVLTVGPDALRLEAEVDVEGYLARISAKDYWRTLRDMLADERGLDRAPPLAEALQRCLRPSADLLAARGIDLVLVAWPGAGGVAGGADLCAAVELAAGRLGCRCVDVATPLRLAQEILPAVLLALRERRRAGR